MTKDSIIFNLETQAFSEIRVDLVETVKNAGVIIFPTDTVYGILGLPCQDVISRINALKRNRSSPFQVLISDIETVPARLLKEEPVWFPDFCSRFWPGAVTLILPALDPAPGISLDGDIGIRFPDHDMLCSIIDECGGYLTATSANLTGGGGSNDPNQIIAQFLEKVDIIVRAGILNRKPSTVVKVSGESLKFIRGGKVEGKLRNFFYKWNIKD